MKPCLVLCLGNEVVSDDGFGPAVARRLETQLGDHDKVDVVFEPEAGFNLLEHLNGRERVLIVDAIVTGASQPGTLHSFPAGTLVPGRSLINSHQINLPTALELGRQLGYDMPSNIQVLAAEAGDVETLSERLTPEVEAAIEPAVSFIRNWANDESGGGVPIGKSRALSHIS